jgi:dimethylamine monooxygenase subunit A
MSVDAFWLDPPWRGARRGYRMGLKPIADGAWLPVPISSAEHARKAALIERNAPPVVAAVPGSELLQQHVLDAVRGRHGTPRMPQAIADDERLPPLARAALVVPEDLCLMQRANSAYRLVAACVCSPSYWSLSEKIGRTLTEVHAPVPGLEAAIGPAMAAFFERISAGVVFERRNWFVHLDAEPFQPRPEVWGAVAGEDLDPERLVMRSERQTLARIAPDAVLFTILVSCRPLSEIARYPSAAHELRAALAALDDDQRAGSGYHHFAAPVDAFLLRIAGA